jgi:hypothetical protein
VILSQTERRNQKENQQAKVTWRLHNSQLFAGDQIMNEDKAASELLVGAAEQEDRWFTSGPARSMFYTYAGTTSRLNP